MTSPRKLDLSTLLSFLLGVGLLASSPQSLPAQSSSGSQNPPTQQEGVTAGDYVIHTSAEIGYRYTNVTGSSDMYDTLVNLQTGPRFLDETFSMQSQDHQGLLFDNLSFNSFGWGGDPNNVLRARVEKNKWYNFLASFRRDQNFFDYDLLVNPLNPPTSSPSIPVLNSAHAFDTTRRMTDIDLTLAPQSVVSFRFGYSHNNMTGPSYTSIHTGTDALLLQPWNTTMNAYRIGMDFKVAPRTVLSFDEFLYYYKGDTDPQLSSFAMAFLPGRAARDQSHQLLGNPHQSGLQRLLQLFPQPAYPYYHSHGAGQPAQQLLPTRGTGRIFYIQRRPRGHAAGRIL